MYADILIIFFALGIAYWQESRVKNLENKLIIVIKAIKKIEEFDKEVSNYHQRDAAERRKLRYQLDNMLKKMNRRFEKVDPGGSGIDFIDKNMEDSFSNKQTYVKNNEKSDF